MQLANEVKYVVELQAKKMGSYLVVFTVLMVVIALGVCIGFSYLMASPDQKDLLYLATGAPTIVLILTALVMLPFQNAGAKMAGYIDFVKSLPVSRKSFLIADVGIWALITVPGIAISIAVAHLIFEPGYNVPWTILPVFVLMVAACFGIGYGYSFLLPAEATMAVSQLIGFSALMFSPINFPIDRMPEWLQFVHELLPIYHMAEVMRASLAHTTFEAGAVSYVVLGVWSVLGFFGAARALEKA